jgi:hypothetical protein
MKAATAVPVPDRGGTADLLFDGQMPERPSASAAVNAPTWAPAMPKRPA